MTEATLFVFGLGMVIHELNEMLSNFLCANKKMKLSFEIKSKK